MPSSGGTVACSPSAYSSAELPLSPDRVPPGQERGVRAAAGVGEGVGQRHQLAPQLVEQVGQLAGGEVRLVVAQVTGVVGVLDGKAELPGQLGEGGHVGRILQEAGELLLELVVAGDEVEDRLARRHGSTDEFGHRLPPLDARRLQ